MLIVIDNYVWVADLKGDLASTALFCVFVARNTDIINDGDGFIATSVFAPAVNLFGDITIDTVTALLRETDVEFFGNFIGIIFVYDDVDVVVRDDVIVSAAVLAFCAVATNAA